jgi:hypothetical protein
MLEHGRGMGPGEGIDPMAFQALADEVKTLRGIVDEINKPPSRIDTFARKMNGS